MPVVRQISWWATIPQLLSVSLAAGIGYSLNGRDGTMWGAAAYLLYSFGSRFLLTRDHRRGVAILRQERFPEAIPAFEASLDFFARYPWIDKYRSIVLMSPSTFAYREIALCNIAFCSAQLGDGKRARASYEQCLAEFPQSSIARTALRLMDASKD